MSRGRNAASLRSLEDAIPELPSSWARARLGELLRLQAGYAFKSKWFVDDGVRLLRGTNIEPGGTRWDDTVYLPHDQAADFERFRLAEGDLVIAMDRPVISTGLKVARLADGDVPALLLQRVGRFLLADEGLAPDLLHAYLNSPRFMEHIGATATGTQLPHISGTDIETAPIAVPPLNEQRRIVAKIDALQARSRRAREALDAVPALLDRFRQSVLAAAFRGDLTADWRAKHPDVEPASALLERIRAERKVRWIEAETEKARARAEARARKKGQAWGPEQDAKAVASARKKAEKKYTAPEPVDAEAEGLPELPEGWCWASFEELSFELRSGTAQRADSTPTAHPVLRSSAVRHGHLYLNDVRYLAEEPKEQDYIVDGDLLFTRLSGTLDYVGNCAIVEGITASLAYPDRLFRARMVDAVVPGLLPLAFECRPLRATMENAAKSSAGHQRISQSDLLAYRIPVPPPQEQAALLRQVVEVSAPSVHVGAAAVNLVPQLDMLDQSILAQAFRGQLVPQDPDDEPAADLLERIKAECEAAGQRGKARWPRGGRAR